MSNITGVHLRDNFSFPSLMRINLPNVLEGDKARALRKGSGLDSVQAELGNKLKYVVYQSNLHGVVRSQTSQRFSLREEGTQSVEKTSKSGGDCDDLSRLYATEAAKLAQQKGRKHYQYGVLSGYVRMKSGRYLKHAVLAVRDMRSRNRFELFDVTQPKKGLRYFGSYNRFGPNNVFPTPKGNKNFILNSYVPVDTEGKFLFTKTLWFVPGK